MTPTRDGEAGAIPAWLEELERLKRAHWIEANEFCSTDNCAYMKAIMAAGPMLLALARKHYISPEEAQRGAR